MRFCLGVIVAISIVGAMIVAGVGSVTSKCPTGTITRLHSCEN